MPHRVLMQSVRGINRPTMSATVLAAKRTCNHHQFASFYIGKSAHNLSKVVSREQKGSETYKQVDSVSERCPTPSQAGACAAIPTAPLRMMMCRCMSTHVARPHGTTMVRAGACKSFQVKVEKTLTVLTMSSSSECLKTYGHMHMLQVPDAVDCDQIWRSWAETGGGRWGDLGEHGTQPAGGGDEGEEGEDEDGGADGEEEGEGSGPDAGHDAGGTGLQGRLRQQLLQVTGMRRHRPAQHAAY